MKNIAVSLFSLCLHVIKYCLSIIYYMETPKPSGTLIFARKISANFDSGFLFLHPFFYSPIIVDGISYMTPLHYYYCMKYAQWKEISDELRLLEDTDDLISKAEGYRKIKGDKQYWEEWTIAKYAIMKKANKTKYDTYEIYRNKLMETGSYSLIYEDPKLDPYWGGTTDNSKNTLGKLLMELRSEYQATYGLYKIERTGEKGIKDFDISMLTLNRESSANTFQNLLKDRDIKGKTLSDLGSSESDNRCMEIKATLKDNNNLSKLFGRVSPLFHLPQNDRALLINESKYMQYEKDAMILSPTSVKPKSLYILVEVIG